MPANAWVARQHDNAIAAFTRSASLEANGASLVRAANLRIEAGRWASAEWILRELFAMRTETFRSPTHATSTDLAIAKLQSSFRPNWAERSR